MTWEVVLKVFLVIIIGIIGFWLSNIIVEFKSRSKNYIRFNVIMCFINLGWLIIIIGDLMK